MDARAGGENGGANKRRPQLQRLLGRVAGSGDVQKRGVRSKGWTYLVRHLQLFNHTYAAIYPSSRRAPPRKKE